ncbi:hypothetical protein PMAYCL1PPCAC_31192 [Pristionchus mayeri]|uniref:Uncharacterized protein n=1 Tax=Pristionchus mayeri TaxID=1317129 RepID=A0AAN5DF62_9BILA|nr:hypothetical protein PMAYCL1PPCAC_31192 [Pristionchus mayeri]
MTGNDGGAAHTASVALQPPVSPQPQQLQQLQQADPADQIWVGRTGPLPIIIPQDKTPRIPHRNDGNSVVLREMECALERYYMHGAQKHGELQLRDDGQYVLFQLPKPKEMPFEKEHDDDQQPVSLGAEEVLTDLMNIFLMDEDLGYVSFSPPERLHIPVEMPAAQLASVSYEDLIPPGVRSRRSGNQRVHPSELRTAQGEARRARQERHVMFELDFSDADDEAEEEEEEQSSGHYSESDDDESRDAVNFEKSLGARENVVKGASTQPPRSLYKRETCVVPAHTFRSYRMARREIEHIRELALDPTGPRALDDEEFKELVDNLGIEDVKHEDLVAKNNSDVNDENFDPDEPSTSSA